MPRNILIFADGTGNEGGLIPDESRTNIYKLYRATRTGPDRASPGFETDSQTAKINSIGWYQCRLPIIIL